MLAYAFLAALAVLSPGVVHGSMGEFGEAPVGCYGDQNSDIAAVTIPALKGLLVDKEPSVIDKYFASDYIQHNPDFPSGNEALFELLKLPFEYEVGQVTYMGDTVWLHSRLTGIGPVPLIALDIFRVADGLIVEHWDVLQPEVPAYETVRGNSMLTVVPNPLNMM